jgi:hypothetical protein
MASRKQRSLFRKTLNKIYSYAIYRCEEGVSANCTLNEFRRNRKTF